MLKQTQSRTTYNTIISFPQGFDGLAIGICTPQGKLDCHDILNPSVPHKITDTNTSQQVVDHLAAYFSNSQRGFITPSLIEGIDLQYKGSEVPAGLMPSLMLLPVTVWW
jgi:hypothetical protein